MKEIEYNIYNLLKNKNTFDKLNIIIKIEYNKVIFKFSENENIVFEDIKNIEHLKNKILFINEKEFKHKIKIDKLEIYFSNTDILKEKNLFLNIELNNLYIENFILEKTFLQMKNNNEKNIINIKNTKSNINKMKIQNFRTKEFKEIKFIENVLNLTFEKCEIDLSDFNYIKIFPEFLYFLNCKVYGKLENKNIKFLKFAKSAIIYPFNLTNNKIKEIKFMSKTKCSIPLYKDSDSYMKEIIDFEKITSNNEIENLTIENYIINKLFAKTTKKITLKNIEIKNLCNLYTKKISLISCNIKVLISNNFSNITFFPRNDLKDIENLNGEKIKIKLSSIYDTEELETIINNSNKIKIKELIIEIGTLYQSTLNQLVLILMVLDKLYKYISKNNGIKIMLLFNKTTKNLIYNSNKKINKIMEIFEKNIKPENNIIFLSNQKDILDITGKFFNLFNGFKIKFPELNNIKLNKNNNLIFDI